MIRQRRSFIRMIVLVTVTTIWCTGSAVADDPWWKRGADLFGGASGDAAELTSGEIASGLKEALRVATERVVSQLGKPGGFERDPAVHIPLPKSLGTVQSTLHRIGMSSSLNALEAKLNEAAEVATPKAQELFVNAIAEMTLDDAKQIYDGPNDAATRYFQSKMSAPLADAMSPVVQSSLSEVGALQKYDEVMGQYRAIPFVPDVKANLTTYVVKKGMDGLFHYLAEQEAAIRANPAARTTALLQKVFGTP